jgi:hypothetical protein
MLWCAVLWCARALHTIKFAVVMCWSPAHCGMSTVSEVRVCRCCRRNLYGCHYVSQDLSVAANLAVPLVECGVLALPGTTCLKLLCMLCKMLLFVFAIR